MPYESVRQLVCRGNILNVKRKQEARGNTIVHGSLFSPKNENRSVFLKYEDGYGLRRKIYGKGKSGSGRGFRNSDSF